MAAIKTKLDAVRASLPDAMVTTYQYAPLVGVTTMTDPAGKSLVYEYDALQRLYRIKDNTGNVRASYCYNYAGQVMSCDAVAVSGWVNPAQLFLLAAIATTDPPLPVTLVNFNAIKQEHTALLTWNTTEEINSERFDVQRSLTGKTGL